MDTNSFHESKLARNQLGIHGSSLVETYPEQDSEQVHGKRIPSALSNTLHVSVTVFEQYSRSPILSKRFNDSTFYIFYTLSYENHWKPGPLRTIYVIYVMNIFTVVVRKPRHGPEAPFATAFQP